MANFDDNLDEQLRTARLQLRQWKDTDRVAFADLNNDPVVMQFFPRTYTQEESDGFVDNVMHHIASNGWGWWAVETRDAGEFIGFVGLGHPAEWHPCAGKLEIGWRLSRQFWGRGYATEAARCALQVGFQTFGFEEIISFTSACNLPSIAVMKKIGMQEESSLGFEHPRIAEGSRLKRHIVYRTTGPGRQEVPVVDK